MPKADFAILGAGAMGSIIGAHLAHAGHSVVMLARGKRARQLAEEGVRISGLVELATPVQVLTDAAQLQGAGVLIVAMKTPGTAQALTSLKHADIELAFSIQNGLWKNEQLQQVFGTDRVLGSLANTSGELLPSGEVLFTRNVNIHVGELAGGESVRAQRVAQTLDACGVRSAAVPDVLAREWTKFVAWAGLMPLSVITRTVTWRYLSDPGSALLLVRLVREVASLAHALGVSLSTEDALLPLRGVLHGPEESAVAVVREVGRSFHSNAPQHRLSALQDLEAGRPLEVEETLGHAVRQAQARGLSLPLLEGCYHLVAALDRMRREQD